MASEPPSNLIPLPVRTQTTPVGTRYDPVYEQTVNSINQGLAGLQSQKERDTRYLNEDYSTASRNLAQNQTKVQAGLSHRMANSGLLHSGVNVGAITNRTRDYQQDVGDLERNKARGLEGIASNIAARQAEYQDRLSAAQADKAERDTAYEVQQAKEAADAQAAKDFADQQRQWMQEIQNSILQSVQPVVAPTGQLSLPPSPQQAIQQAIRSVPQPQQAPVAQPATRDQIRTFQQMLNEQGAYKGDYRGLTVDGLVGPKTLQAYNYYRSLYKLPPVNKITQADVELVQTQPVISRAYNSPTNGMGVL